MKVHISHNLWWIYNSLLGHKFSHLFFLSPLLDIRGERVLRVSVPCTKNRQIYSQGATLQAACHMSTRHWSINCTSHFISPLDRHNLKQRWACRTCACLIPVTANSMDRAGKPHLFRIRLTFQDRDYKSQPTSKVENDFLYLLALDIPVGILFYNINCYSVVATYPIWAFKK